MKLNSIERRLQKRHKGKISKGHLFEAVIAGMAIFGVSQLLLIALVKALF